MALTVKLLLIKIGGEGKMMVKIRKITEKLEWEKKRINQIRKDREEQ